MAVPYGPGSSPASSPVDWGGATPREVEAFHTKDDVDTRPEAHHHTIGPGPNQAAPGSLVARVDALDGQGESPGSGSEVNPPGSVVLFAGSIEPPGWGFADGAAISRADNPKLFAAIGTAYGAGNGTTTFNKPNLKGRVPVGRDTSQTEFDVLGETGGAKTHTLTTGEMPSHSHPPASGSNFYHSGIGRALANGGTGAFDFAVAQAATGSSGGGAPHNNLQPYLVMNYIIRLG